MDVLSKYRNFWEKEITASSMAQISLIQRMDKNFKDSIQATKSNVHMSQLLNDEIHDMNQVRKSELRGKSHGDNEMDSNERVIDMQESNLDWSPIDSIIIDKKYPLKPVFISFTITWNKNNKGFLWFCVYVE